MDALQKPRKKRIKGLPKKHTSLYLMPRHETHLEFLMTSYGKTMNGCICDLIDSSIREYNPNVNISSPKKKKNKQNDGDDNE